jgi:hypothetical protein
MDSRNRKQNHYPIGPFSPTGLDVSSQSLIKARFVLLLKTNIHFPTP